MMKQTWIRFLSLLLIAAMSLSLIGCDLGETFSTIESVFTEETDDHPLIIETPGETSAPETKQTETQPPETKAPETKAPETKAPETKAPETKAPETTPTLDKDGVYTSKDDVALYLHLYGKLPKNFVTKSKARDKGWEGGSLEPYFPGCSIGGDYFGNNEGLLPKNKTYHECDIDTKGAKSRGAKRIVYSTDGYIYYTDDHYESFTLLYGGNR